MKPYLSWPDNDCTVGRTSLWGALNPDLMRLILQHVPGATFTPTFNTGSYYDRALRERGITLEPDPLYEFCFQINTERIGDRSADRPKYVASFGFYVNWLTDEDVERLRAVFDIGSRGGACVVSREQDTGPVISRRPARRRASHWP